MVSIDALAEALAVNLTETPTGCWISDLHVNWDGYVQVSRGEWRPMPVVRHRTSRRRAGVMLHRLALVVDGRLDRPEVTPGETVDHLCRNPACCRPDHLEVVPHRTNILRGEGPTAVNARKTHCPKGHPYTADHLDAAQLRLGHRACATCRREHQAESVAMREHFGLSQSKWWAMAPSERARRRAEFRADPHLWRERMR